MPAILGSLAVGTAMFAASVYLSQYFQVSRGYTATRAGVLTIPMMGGLLVSSIVAGRPIGRTGKLKPFAVVGMTIQNFIQVVQNSVPLKDIGTASTTVTFFRSLGVTFGVTVLGAVLARQVADRTAQEAVLRKPVTLRTSLDASEPNAATAAEAAQPRR